jgi:uncharacterized protein (DUF983 family)
VPTQEYIKLKATVNATQELIRKHKDKLSKLLEKCPHEVLISCDSYHGGGYDYTAYTRYWEQCELCGKEFNIHVRDHGTFG